MELLVDAHGLAEILCALSDVASQKAEHIRSSYSDEPLAVLWSAAARGIAKAMPAANDLP